MNHVPDDKLDSGISYVQGRFERDEAIRAKLY
jgi:hypothetical protein